MNIQTGPKLSLENRGIQDSGRKSGIYFYPGRYGKTISININKKKFKLYLKNYFKKCFFVVI